MLAFIPPVINVHEEYEPTADPVERQHIIDGVKKMKIGTWTCAAIFFIASVINVLTWRVYLARESKRSRISQPGDILNAEID